VAVHGPEPLASALIPDFDAVSITQMGNVGVAFKRKPQQLVDDAHSGEPFLVVTKPARLNHICRPKWRCVRSVSTVQVVENLKQSPEYWRALSRMALKGTGTAGLNQP